VKRILTQTKEKEKTENIQSSGINTSLQEETTGDYEIVDEESQFNNLERI
jgi:hypothetical protein